MNRPIAALLLFGLPLALASCGKEEVPAGQASTVEAAPSDAVASEKSEEQKQVVPPVTPEVAATPAPEAPPAPPSPYAVTDPHAGLGDFGSAEPLEREDMPERGVIKFSVAQDKSVFSPMEHWEQYNFPFKSKRWGRYSVRVTYALRTSTLGVQFKFGEMRLKKQLVGTGGAKKVAYLGDIYIADGGDQFMALYTPNGVGWASFVLDEIRLIPAPEGEEVAPAEDGTLQLLAKDATTWSENMRYEPKPEKNCLGFWTETEDFAEWEFTVDKAGKYDVTVHQGCGAGGGSEVALLLGDQKLEFTVKDTGGFQNWAPVNVGQLDIKEPGTYRLAVKPQSKNGGAIMDVQKIILAPVS